MFVILLAGLTAIPPELYEAAELDGVGALADILVHHPAAARADDPARGHVPAPRRGQALRHHLHDHRRRAGDRTYTSSFYLYQMGFQQFHLAQATAGSWIFLDSHRRS